MDSAEAEVGGQLLAALEELERVDTADPDRALTTLEVVSRTCVAILGQRTAAHELADLVRSDLAPYMAPVAARWAGTDPEDPGQLGDLPDDLVFLRSALAPVRDSLTTALPSH